LKPPESPVVTGKIARMILAINLTIVPDRRLEELASIVGNTDGTQALKDLPTMVPAVVMGNPNAG